MRQTHKADNKSHNVNFSIPMSYKNRFGEPFFAEPLCFSLIYKNMEYLKQGRPLFVTWRTRLQVSGIVAFEG